MNHQLNDTILKNKVTPLKSYAEWTFHDITNSTFYKIRFILEELYVAVI